MQHVDLPSRGIAPVIRLPRIREPAFDHSAGIELARRVLSERAAVATGLWMAVGRSGAQETHAQVRRVAVFDDLFCLHANKWITHSEDATFIEVCRGGVLPILAMIR